MIHIFVFNHINLVEVEVFEYPNSPRSYVVGGPNAPARVSQGKEVLVDGSGPSSPFDEIPSNEEVHAALDWGHWSRTLQRLMALFAHGTRLGSAQRSKPSSRLPTSRKVHEGPVQTTQSLDNYSDYEDMECCLARRGKSLNSCGRLSDND